MQTEYIARISYGKDSLKMLEVIHSRGLPLDRITTTDVWATDTISANFPPMDAFKERMDQRIWDLYRIEVEHLCARNKDSSKKTYEQMFYHVPVRRERERERDGLQPGSILGFPDLWNPWCQAGLKRNAKPSGARNRHWLTTKHPVQLVPEAQTASRCNSGVPGTGASLVPGGAQIQSSDTKDSQHKSLRGAESSRSTRSEPRFPMSAPRGAETEISWNIWELQPTSRNVSGSLTIGSGHRWWSSVLTKICAVYTASTTICCLRPTKHPAGMAVGSATIRELNSSETYGNSGQTIGRC